MSWLAYWLALTAVASLGYRWLARHEQRTIEGYLMFILSAWGTVGLSLLLYHRIYI